jgi:energy-coupling factor transporter ATP-binding protein EcfA2
MQLTKLSIDSFLKIRAMDLHLDRFPIHLIAGHNECGKSSIHEAIRYCMLGETARVSYKKDYEKMIRAGSKSATIRLDYVDSEGNHDFIQRDVATGKVLSGCEDEPEFAVAEVMDATKFPYFDAKHQRKMLSQLLNIKIDKKEVGDALKRKGVPDGYVEQIMPMLRAGFEAAHKEAKAKQSEHRSHWEVLTGEKWGTQKGYDWKPEKRIVGKGMFTAQKRQVAKYKKAHETALKKVGAVEAVTGGFGAPCPACGVPLQWHGMDITLKAEDPRSDLKKNTAAKKEADNLGGLYQSELKTLQKMEVDLDFNERMEEIKAASVEMHEHVLHWMKAADELAPDGIPGQIIADKLKPMNHRLRETAMKTTWDQVTIMPTMDIVIDTLPYSLCSESSQWRAQAAIAEAISFISKIGVICLDRIDVLDLQNRSRLLKWIHNVCTDHQTILLFGTLKEAPAKLPNTIGLHWLESGEDVSAKAA